MGILGIQQNRKIVQDFRTTALGEISNPFARLVYIASLRDPGKDVYKHAGLAAVYRHEDMQEALGECHEELFERILDSPLRVQEHDLRSYLGAAPAGLHFGAVNWKKQGTYAALFPSDSPDYLRELFCSNVRTILDIITNSFSPVESASGKGRG